MKITMRKGKKSLVIHSANNEFGVKLPESEGPLLLEAEFDERSPIQMIVPGKSPIPVTALKLTHSKMYWVKTFKRHTKAGVVTVEAHRRRKPVILKGKAI